jgi:hypothetical protein
MGLSFDLAEAQMCLKGRGDAEMYAIFVYFINGVIIGSAIASDIINLWWDE